MNRTMSILIVVLGLLMCAGVARAAISVGDSFQMYYLGGYAGGGPFTFHDTTSGDVFTTFCASENEFFYPGKIYTITSLEGGFNFAAAALYYNWRMGKLGGLSLTDYTDIQEAFWYLMNTNPHVTDFPPDYDPNAADNAYVTLAESYKWKTDGPVVLIDFSELYPYDGASGRGGQPEFGIDAVPEPSTLLLLGAGLVGLAAFRKKIRA